MINWKVVVGSGATAAVLSLLTGIISGVSFGPLLLRALLWCVIFCGVGAAISFLISKYLPELLSLSPPEGKGEMRPNVDIVIPDENPHAGREDEDTTGSEEDVFEKPDSEGGDDQYERGGDLPPAGGDNLVEEVEELGAPGSGAGGRSPVPSLDGGEEAEELPDFDSDTNDFSLSGESGSPPPDGVSDISRISGRSSTVDILGHKADSEEIAQAIRTALKKDQKG